MLIPISLDTETDLITEQVPAPPLACVSLSCKDPSVLGSRNLLLHGNDAGPVVLELLEDPRLLIVGHGFDYDTAVFMAHDPAMWPAVFNAYDSNRIVDTEIRQKLSDIAGGVYRGFEDADDQAVKITYRLGDVSERLLNRHLDKDTWRLRYGELRPYPIHQWPEGARKYALDDADATLDCYEVQEQNAEYFEDQFRQVRSALWLRLMSNWGFRTDERGVRQLAELTSREYEAIAIDLRAAGLLRPDHRKRDGTIKPGARNEAATRSRIWTAYQFLGERCPMTDGGKEGLNPQPSIGRDACEKSGDALLIRYAEFSHLKTVLSKDIPLLMRGATDPIHAYFENLLETGRTSSKPNLQNQARKGGIRECFVPRIGTVFAAADYGMLELCTLAQVCLTFLGHSTLGEAINAGRDPHLEIAADILGITYERAKYLKAEEDRIVGSLPKGQKMATPIDDARQTGKVCNFGFPGGLGAGALVHFAWNNYRVALTPQRARELKDIWIARWPEMREYFAFVNAQVNQSFPTITQLFSNRHRGNPRYTEACNSYFQGLGADVAKAAGWLICKACYLDTESPLFGCRIVNFVHDEFILEAPEHRAHEAVIELSRLMVLAAEPWLPDVKIKAEPVLMRRWSKKAKAIYSEAGRLVPWDTAA